MPKFIMKDKGLDIEAKGIYAYLVSYSGRGKSSFPSVSLMCEDLQISENRFYKYRKQLTENGYVTIKKNRKNGKRDNNIYILNLHPQKQHLQNEGIENEGIEFEGTNNNSSNNNNSNNNIINNRSKDYTPATKNEQEDTDKIPYKKIVFYLNEKADRQFKHTSQKTKRKIRARYNEGFNFSDFLTVIDKKVAEWENTQYSKYLRPVTLFGTKFEGYLNQPWPEDYDDDPEGFDQLKEIWGELEEEEEFIDG